MRAVIPRRFRPRYLLRSGSPAKSTLSGLRFCGPTGLAAVLIVLLAFPPASFGQALRLSSAAARQGESVDIEIALTSPAGNEPQALQWETTIPTARLSFTEDQLQVGVAARNSDKSSTCVTKSNSPETRTLVCILAGGLKTIPNGVIALLRLRILPEAPPGPATVRADRGIAVLKGLKQVQLPPVETVVTVRHAAGAQDAAGR